MSKSSAYSGPLASISFSLGSSSNALSSVILSSSEMREQILFDSSYGMSRTRHTSLTTALGLSVPKVMICPTLSFP